MVRQGGIALGVTDGSLVDNLGNNRIGSLLYKVYFEGFIYSLNPVDFHITELYSQWQDITIQEFVYPL